MDWEKIYKSSVVTGIITIPIGGMIFQVLDNISYCSEPYAKQCESRLPGGQRTPNLPVYAGPTMVTSSTASDTPSHIP